MKVEITIPKLHQKIADASGYSRRTVIAVEQQVIESALNIQRVAKKKVNVDTGRLRDSIDMSLSFDKMGAAVGTNVHYGKHQEKIKPYLGPAAFIESKNFHKKISEILKRK